MLSRLIGAIQDIPSSCKEIIVMNRLLAVFALLSFSSVVCLAEHLTGYVSDEQCATSGSKAAKATDGIAKKPQ